MSDRVEVVGLGNSMVDLIQQTDDAFLKNHQMAKGAMTLIDEARAERLYDERDNPRVISGGSAANTVFGVASFGVRAAYIGKVKNDPLGAAYRDDIHASGVDFSTPPANEGPATGRCFVYVTPDGERTMMTYLGASSYLSPIDVDETLVREASIVYLEGYMWDRQAAKAAFQKAGRIARAAGRRVALTLSDAFCVDRFRAEFLDLVRSGVVDTIFANTEEVLSLYQTTDFSFAIASLQKEGALAFVTRSEKGSLIVEPDGLTEAPAFPIKALVDTTGAGDFFAAGCLAGLARNADLYDCALLGALAAGDVIQRVGARPSRPLAEIARERRLLVPA